MAHPLLCWDIITEGMNRRKIFADDSKAIAQIMLANEWCELPASLDSSLIWENKTIVITDTCLKIVLATTNMYAMNGYRAEEVIGKHPKMFQGEATTPASRRVIKLAVDNALPFNCDIINYRRDGSLYNCRIAGFPVFNNTGVLVNYVALENIV